MEPQHDRVIGFNERSECHPTDRRRTADPFQIVTIICCALVSALDGIDTQSIGVAAPFIAEELGVKLAHFGPIFSSALVGATVGAASFGPLADRFGRKTLLIVAVLLIGGGFTILTVFANSVPMLMAIRVLAGLGLGGATPCFIALTSEYTPARLRAALVTLMWSAFPLGGLLGGLLNWYLIPHAGWRAIFYIGGVAPLVLAVVLFLYLPEFDQVPSRPAQRPEGRRPHRGPLPLVPCPGRRAFCLGREALAWCLDSAPIHGRPRTWNAIVVGAVFHGFRRAHGRGLVDACAIEAQRHFANTAFVVAFNGLGGFIGQSTSGRLIQRFGIVPVLIPAFLLGAVATVGLGYGASSIALAATFIGLIGVFMGLGTGGAIALAATIYPTPIRSTGAGWGMAMGRFGQIIGPLIAGVLLGAGWTAGPIMTVTACGGLIGAVFVVLFSVWLSRRRVEGLSAGQAPAKTPAPV